MQPWISQECDWTINVPDDIEVVVEFDQNDPFEIEAANGGRQCYDILLVKILATDESTRFCGNTFQEGFLDDNNIQNEPRLQFFGPFEMKFKVNM